MKITKTMINDLTKDCESKIFRTFINKNGTEYVHVKWFKNGKEQGIQDIMPKHEWRKK